MYVRKILTMSLMLAMLFGCSDKENIQQALALQSIRNESSVDDLSSLLGKYPEIADTSLRDIGILSKKTKTNNSDLQFAILEESKTELDPALAQRAQKLLDEILSDFAFEAEFSAVIKIMGVAINHAQEMIQNMHAQSKEFHKTTGLEGYANKFDEDLLDQEITCEAVVNNPFLKIPKAEIQRINNANKKLIKEALPNCPSLSAGKFLQCTKDFNTLTNLINTHVNCDIKNLEEFEKVMNQALGGKFAEIENSVRNCIMEDFAECDFKPEQAFSPNTSRQTPKRTHEMHKRVEQKKNSSKFRHIDIISPTLSPSEGEKIETDAIKQDYPPFQRISPVYHETEGYREETKTKTNLIEHDYFSR